MSTAEQDFEYEAIDDNDADHGRLERRRCIYEPEVFESDEEEVDEENQFYSSGDKNERSAGKFLRFEC